MKITRQKQPTQNLSSLARGECFRMEENPDLWLCGETKSFGTLSVGDCRTLITRLCDGKQVMRSPDTQVLPVRAHVVIEED